MSLSREDAARIGGSDLAGLLGLSPWQTPLSIYARVVSTLEWRTLADADDAPKRRGRHLEDAVLRLYAEETGNTVVAKPTTPVLKRSFFRASLDAVAYVEPNATARRVVEVKTAGLSEIRKWGEVGTDAIPQQYLFQTEWYLGHALQVGMVDLRSADLAALVGGDLRLYVVPFDAELFAMLEAAVERFWKDHVIPRRPPPVTDPIRDVDAIGALYPRHSGAERHWETFTSEEQRAILDHLKAKARLERAKLRAAGTEAVLKLMLKETPKVYGLPASTGAKSITWRQNKDGQETDWRKVAEALGAGMSEAEFRVLVQQHTTPKEGARPLRVTAMKEEE